MPLKCISIFLLSVLTQTTFAQNNSVLIPYKKGNLFGLCNKQGQLIVQPSYETINWAKDEYFKYQRILEINDTLEVKPHQYLIRKNDKIKVTGLIYKGKEIINNQPYDEYRIYPNKCIIAHCETRSYNLIKQQYAYYKQRTKFESLLTVDGHNVYEDNFRRLRIEDTLFIELKNNKRKKLLLFACEDFKYRTGLFLYDIEGQSISQWLITNALKLSIRRINTQIKTFEVAYKDTTNNEVVVVVNYSSTKIKVFNKEEQKEEIKPKQYSSNDLVVADTKMLEVGESDVAVPVEAESIRDVVPVFRPYYQRINDSLFYFYKAQKRNYIDVEKDRFYFYDASSNIHYDSALIYQQNGKFGIIFCGELLHTVYDSLFYFAGKFLGYKYQNNHLSCGVIAKNGTTVIPFIYDSLQGQMKAFTLQFYSKDLELKLTEKSNTYGYTPKKNKYVKPSSDKLLAFKQGKYGLITINNEEIIPFEYDLIAENGTENSYPRNSNYIILKQNNKYGITQLGWDKQSKHLQTINSVSAIFNHIPLYYYNNYYNQEGFKLFALYNQNYQFMGFANESGYVYSE